MLQKEHQRQTGRRWISSWSYILERSDVDVTRAFRLFEVLQTKPSTELNDLRCKFYRKPNEPNNFCDSEIGSEMRSGDAWIGGTKYAKTIRNQTPATALTHTHTSTSQGENERIGLRPPGYAKWGPPAAEAPLHVNTAIFAVRVCRSGGRRLGKFTLELYHNSNSEYWRYYNNYFVQVFTAKF